MNSDRIFLTGGSGFVGRHFIPFFREHGYKVFALVRSNAAAAVVRELGAFAIPGSLYNHTALKNTMQLCENVVHAAAFFRFWGDPKTFYTTNVEGTKALLDAAKESGIRTFIYIGAASVISGKSVENVDETYMPPRLPRDLYSETKYQAELAVIAANSPDMQTIVLRPPFIWGSDNPHVDMLRDILEKGHFRWISGGRHALSTCHVDNLAAAVLAATNSNSGGEVYHITDGERWPFKDFFTAYAHTQGIDLGEKTIPRWMALAAAHLITFLWKQFKQKGEPPLVPAMVRLLGTNLTVNDTKARTELNYKNVLTVTQGLETLGGAQ
ncbi:NAD-dependent epimerase/dehydratase family protein [candidate division KSB1 bacterium]|nr:NAD-dependent epimerase/dehydratase family protein [candidate division KSB1 bacterium]RQW07115.1 MAG: NAD-dependent epimerase/dehydratase family protein [candidate division KSB1 bacterium]